MKYCKQVIAVTLLSFAGSLLFAQKNAEEEAVKKVIEQETSSYFEANYPKWANTWAHDSVCYVIRSGPGGYDADMGWSKINEEYKSYMQIAQPMNQSQYASYAKKYDYNFYITGNAAIVTFKEAKGVLETRTLVKDNSAWKITGMTIVDVPFYKAKDAFNNIKAFEGKWKLDLTGIKADPPVKNWEIKTNDVNIHETSRGIEMETDQSGVYNNRFYKNPTENEQLIFNNNTNEIEYFDLQTDALGQTSVNLGKATSDSIGRFTISIPYTDKPSATASITTYRLADDGAMITTYTAFDKNGKQTQTFEAKFIRQ